MQRIYHRVVVVVGQFSAVSFCLSRCVQRKNEHNGTKYKMLSKKTSFASGLGIVKREKIDFHGGNFHASFSFLNAASRKTLFSQMEKERFFFSVPF